MILDAIMSHANATFVFADRPSLFGEYDGTSDVMLPLMFDTRDQAADHWRNQEWKDCACGRESVNCIAHTDYGLGFWWHAKACLTCGVFIGPKMPFDDDVETTDSENPPQSSDVL